MYASSYVLVTTALDRYLVICHPLKTQAWSSQKVHAMVGVAWALSLLFALPQFFIFRHMEIAEGAGVYDCWAVFTPIWTLPLYITWITFAIYIVPFLLLTLAYGRICFVVWHSMKNRDSTKWYKKQQVKIRYLKFNVSGLCLNSPE